MSKPNFGSLKSDGATETKAASLTHSNENVCGEDDDERNSAIYTLPIPEIDEPPSSIAVTPRAPDRPPGRASGSLKEDETVFSIGSTDSYGMESETAGSEGLVVSGTQKGPPKGGYCGLDPTSGNVVLPTPMTQSHIDYYAGADMLGEHKQPVNHPYRVKNKPNAPLPPVPETSNFWKVLPRRPPPQIKSKPMSLHPHQTTPKPGFSSMRSNKFSHNDISTVLNMNWKYYILAKRSTD